MELGRRCQDTSQEIHMLNKRQDICKNSIEGSECKVEHMKDCMTKSLKK